jgi:hypothetical protein
MWLFDHRMPQEQLSRELLQSLQKTGRQNGLKTFEIVTAVFIDLEDWTTENDMATAALKVPIASPAGYHAGSVN